MTTEYTAIVVATAALAISIVSLTYAVMLRRYITVLLSALDSRALRRYLRAVEARQRGRDRKRFIVFKLLTGKDLSKDDLEELVRKSFKQLFGTITLSVAGASIAHYDPERGAGVLRVRSTHKNHAILALAAIDVLTDGKVIIQPLRTTGTLRKAMKYAEGV